MSQNAALHSARHSAYTREKGDIGADKKSINTKGFNFFGFGGEDRQKVQAAAEQPKQNPRAEAVAHPAPKPAAKPPLPRAAVKKGKKKAAPGDSRPVVEIDLNAATPRPRKVVADGQASEFDENLKSKRMSMTTRGVFTIPSGRLSVGSIGGEVRPMTRSRWDDDEVRIGRGGLVEFDLSF